MVSEHIRSKVLSAIKRNPNATQRILGELASIKSLSQVYYAIDGLIMQGRIQKNDRYTVIDAPPSRKKGEKR